MKKEKKVIHGNTYYLLGVDSDGIKHYLKAPSWDCGWYWGFGYVNTFGRCNKMMYHFESFERGCNLYDGFKKNFVESVFTNSELWTMCELMKSFYVLRKTAEVLGLGSSNYTTNPCSDLIKNPEEVKRINEVVLPKIFEEIEKLLTE